jgi:hypothetical protein
MAKLTHGEAIFLKRESLDFTLSIEKMVYTFHRQVPPRMSYEKAMTYYKNKLNNVWESLK